MQAGHRGSLGDNRTGGGRTVNSQGATSWGSAPVRRGDLAVGAPPNGGRLFPFLLAILLLPACGCRPEDAFRVLRNVFPAETATWAKWAGVTPEHCVGFRLERNGLAAGIVLARPPDSQHPAFGAQHCIFRTPTASNNSPKGFSSVNYVDWDRR